MFVDSGILKFCSHMQNWHWPSRKSKLQAAFGLRVIELSVRHFRFHFRFRFTRRLPRQPPAWVLLFAAYCILHPFSNCAFVMLPVTPIVSRVQLCPECTTRRAGHWGEGCGTLLTPSTNGNELVLHCATWPAANLIQLVGTGMRLNGIYLFNCRAPPSTKLFSA